MQILHYIPLGFMPINQSKTADPILSYKSAKPTFTQLQGWSGISVVTYFISYHKICIIGNHSQRPQGKLCVCVCAQTHIL